MQIKFKILILLGLLTVGCLNTSFGQQSEVKDFEQKTSKTFNSKGHSKNRGLIFSINYPSSYRLHDLKNENIVKGFIHKQNQLMYVVGVVKSAAQITKADEKVILSEANFKQSVSAITGSNHIFLNYANGFKIRGLNAAYLDYLTNITEDTKGYMRQYLVIYRNYLLTISFTVPHLPNKTLEDTRKIFDSYKPFFNLATNSLLIQSQ